MVAPFLVQNSASQITLPLGDYHPNLKSMISMTSITNAIRRRKNSHQNLPVYPQNYTKAHGHCILSLNAEHEASSGLPVFSSGSVISGSLEISKVSKMLESIQIMVNVSAGTPVCGGPRLILFHRSQGGLSFRSWAVLGLEKASCFPTCFTNGAANRSSSPPPTPIPLSYPLPSKYIDHATGIEHQMPPSYKARLNTAVPGLRVKIQYDLSAKIVRSRRKIPFMTKTTR
jgi:hypothetical protein